MEKGNMAMFHQDAPLIVTTSNSNEVSSGRTGDAYLTDGQLVHNNVSMCLELNTFSLPPVDPSVKPSENGLYTGTDSPNKESGSHKTDSFNVLPMHHLSLQTNRSSQLRSHEYSNSTQTFVMNDKQIQLFVSANGKTQVIRAHAKDTVKKVLTQLPSLCIAWVEADGKRLSLNHPLEGVESSLTLFGYTGGLRGGVGEVRVWVQLLRGTEEAGTPSSFVMRAETIVDELRDAVKDKFSVKLKDVDANDLTVHQIRNGDALLEDASIPSNTTRTSPLYIKAPAQEFVPVGAGGASAGAGGAGAGAGAGGGDTTLVDMLQQLNLSIETLTETNKVLPNQIVTLLRGTTDDGKLSQASKPSKARLARLKPVFDKVLEWNLCDDPNYPDVGGNHFQDVFKQIQANLTAVASHRSNPDEAMGYEDLGAFLRPMLESLLEGPLTRTRVTSSLLKSTMYGVQGKSDQRIVQKYGPHIVERISVELKSAKTLPKGASWKTVGTQILLPGDVLLRQLCDFGLERSYVLLMTPEQCWVFSFEYAKDRKLHIIKCAGAFDLKQDENLKSLVAHLLCLFNRIISDEIPQPQSLTESSGSEDANGDVNDDVNDNDGSDSDGGDSSGSSHESTLRDTCLDNKVSSGVAGAGGCGQQAFSLHDGPMPSSHHCDNSRTALKQHRVMAMPNHDYWFDRVNDLH